MRSSEKSRTTLETQVTLTLNLDGNGVANIDTGIGFFNHMLESFTKHSGFDLTVLAHGDLHVDSHHTVEDIGIVLGDALRCCLGEKRGIERFGEAIIPMDEALIQAVVDLSGRACCANSLMFTVERIGDLDAENLNEFFYSFAANGLFNLHMRQLAGINNHHIAEGAFKALARALKTAVSITGDSLPTTKGFLS